MKSGERNAKKKSRYDNMETAVDKKAEQSFRRPAMVKSKLTTLAAVKIIERNMEYLDDGSRQQLGEIAAKCMRGKGPYQRGGDGDGNDTEQTETIPGLEERDCRT